MLSCTHLKLVLFRLVSVNIFKMKRIANQNFLRNSRSERPNKHTHGLVTCVYKSNTFLSAAVLLSV
jgi:hypothetical protein